MVLASIILVLFPLFFLSCFLKMCIISNCGMYSILYLFYFPPKYFTQLNSHYCHCFKRLCKTPLSGLPAFITQMLHLGHSFQSALVSTRELQCNWEEGNKFQRKVLIGISWIYSFPLRLVSRGWGEQKMIHRVSL